MSRHSADYMANLRRVCTGAVPPDVALVVRPANEEAVVVLGISTTSNPSGTEVFAEHLLLDIILGSQRPRSSRVISEFLLMVPADDDPVGMLLLFRMTMMPGVSLLLDSYHHHDVLAALSGRCTVVLARAQDIDQARALPAARAAERLKSKGIVWNAAGPSSDLADVLAFADHVVAEEIVEAALGSDFVAAFNDSIAEAFGFGEVE